MLKLEQGRPADTSGRLEKEIRVYDFLDKLGVIYDRVDHEALMTMEACEEADRVLEATICKNLFLCTANKKEFYLLMIVGDKRLVTKDVSKKLGTSRLSFANESYMEEYLDPNSQNFRPSQVRSCNNETPCAQFSFNIALFPART